MELERTFVLKNKRTYKRSLNIYVTDARGKTEKRNITFTTERLVDVKLRTTNARSVAAEYFAANEAEVNALLSDSSYGITFVRKDDPEGKLKRPTKVISSQDAEKAALKNLFAAYGMDFNDALPVDVLKAQYSIHINAMAGKNISEGVAKSIPAEPVDLTFSGLKSMLRAKFVEKYGYEVPSIVYDDSTFLDGLSNPDGFDPIKYIEDRKAQLEESGEHVAGQGQESTDPPETIEVLRAKYFEKTGQNVPVPMKNNADWIKSKLS